MRVLSSFSSVSSAQSQFFVPLPFPWRLKMIKTRYIVSTYSQGQNEANGMRIEWKIMSEFFNVQRGKSRALSHGGRSAQCRPDWVRRRQTRRKKLASQED
jgi:hypothetical protein